MDEHSIIDVDAEIEQLIADDIGGAIVQSNGDNKNHQADNEFVYKTKEELAEMRPLARQKYQVERKRHELRQSQIALRQAEARASQIERKLDTRRAILDGRLLQKFVKNGSYGLSEILICDFWHNLAENDNLCLTSTSTCPENLSSSSPPPNHLSQLDLAVDCAVQHALRFFSELVRLQVAEF